MYPTEYPDNPSREDAFLSCVCSNVLSKAQVTILYVSTYFSDYTLILADAVETAVHAFQEHGFHVNHRGVSEGEPDESETLDHVRA